MLSREGFAALRPVVTELKKLGVRYYIGGPVASSKYGHARMTHDIDLVAELRSEHVEHFVEALLTQYYVNLQTAADAVAWRSCFNLVHYLSIYKVDILLARSANTTAKPCNDAKCGR